MQFGSSSDGRPVAARGEGFEFLKAWIGTALAFAVLYSGGQIASPAFVQIFILAALTAGLGVVLHELAHMICDHGAAAGLTLGDAAALLPALDSAMVARVLGRSRYTEVEEREAELLATMIAERARGSRGQHVGDEVQGLRQRLRATLG